MDSGLYLPRGLWEFFLKSQAPPRKERVASGMWMVSRRELCVLSSVLLGVAFFREGVGDLTLY